MSAGTEPARWSQARTGSEGVTLEWLDALAAGTCTPEAFLAAMRGQLRGDSDESWETLSLLDQYYRRGKIKADVFQMLKSRLESSAIRGEGDKGANAPGGARPQPRPHAGVPAAPAQKKLAPGAAAPAPREATPAPREATPAPREAAPAPRDVGPLSREAGPATREAAVASYREPGPVQQGGPIREIAVGDMLRERYRIRGLLGHGVMGTVFEAMDEYRLALPAAGQRLAIKLLHSAVTQRDEVLIELQRQFQHVQLLSHPNILRVHEFDRDGDIAFFTMELLTGAPLSGVLTMRNGTGLPRPYALAVMRDVGSALSYAHSHGVIHGDVSPQNIFITNEGELRVMDFGATNRMLRDRAADMELSDTAPVAPPGYASCQVLEGQQPDARDDVFSFACVAYVLLAGRHPFPNRTALEGRAQRLRPRCPPGLGAHQWRVLREGLRWERDERPSDLQKWLDRLSLAGASQRLPALSVLVNAPPSRSSTGVLSTAAVTILAVLAAAGFWAVTDYDSLSRHALEWTGQAPAAPENSGKTPAHTEALPQIRKPSPSAPASMLKPPVPEPAVRETAAAPSAPSPPAVNRAVPAPHTNPIPAPTTAPSVTPSAAQPAATAAATPSPTPGSRADPPARLALSDASARAANSGPARIEMATDTVDVQPAETTASVTVHRKGSLHGDASFTWWTESGTAKPGKDFAAAVPRVERIEDGSRSVILNIPVSRGPRTQAKSFYVVIDRTDAGPALGERNLTMVTLQPGE